MPAVKRKAIPKAVRQQVYDSLNGHCGYCGCEITYKEMQVDHIEAVYLHEAELNAGEAEQYHPYNRYKGDFEKFQSDWKNEEYDPGMTFTFKDSEVEVLEVLQEEVDNIDHEAVKKQVAAAEDAQYQKRRKQRQRRKQRASKGSRYHRKFF